MAEHFASTYMWMEFSLKKINAFSFQFQKKRWLFKFSICSNCNDPLHHYYIAVTVSYWIQKKRKNELTLNIITLWYGLSYIHITLSKTYQIIYVICQLYFFISLFQCLIVILVKEKVYERHARSAKPSLIKFKQV